MNREELARLLDYLAESVMTDPDAFLATAWQKDRLAAAAFELGRRGFFAWGSHREHGYAANANSVSGFSALKDSNQLACLVVTGVAPDRTKHVVTWVLGSTMDPSLVAKPLPTSKGRTRKASVSQALRNPPGCTSLPWAAERPLSPEVARLAEEAQGLGDCSMPKSACFRHSSETWDTSVGDGARMAMATVFRDWSQGVLELPLSPSESVKTQQIPLGSAHTVVMWDGADLSDKHIKLARVRTAYLEAHGEVKAAMAELKKQKIKISLSTFYKYVEDLDRIDPAWRVRKPIPTEPETEEDE